MIAYYAQNIQYDEEMLAPLGLVTWAAIRLHHTIRDTLDLQFGEGLSQEHFDKTLGQAMHVLKQAAANAGEPWASAIADWHSTYGSVVLDKRNSIAHAIAYTADDGKQAIMRPLRHGGTRITVEDLHDAAGHLTLASVRLGEARQAYPAITTKEQTS